MESVNSGRDPHADAWTLFWAEQGPDSRCIANAHPDVRDALAAHWSSFAGTLPQDAHILDLGCGAGVVGRTLVDARSDLQVTGIDVAKVPPSSHPRIRLLDGMAMEDLPFGEGAFDAAVSQFGIEYGDVRRAAAALARILKPDAPVSLIVHHSGSAIVAQGRARREVFDLLLGETARQAFLAGDTAALEHQIATAGQAAPREPILAPIAQALRGGAARGAPERAAIWDRILAALGPERELLAALGSACVAPEALSAWLQALAEGVDVRTAEALRRPSGEPIAWKVQGTRVERRA